MECTHCSNLAKYVTEYEVPEPVEFSESSPLEAFQINSNEEILETPEVPDVPCYIRFLYFCPKHRERHEAYNQGNQGKMGFLK